MSGTFPKNFSQVATSQGYFPKCKIFQLCNFPNGNFPSLSLSQRSTTACSSLGAWPDSPSSALGLHFSLRGLRKPNLTFGKLPLWKFHIWEVATWEIITQEVAIEKMPLEKYLTSIERRQLDLSSDFVLCNEHEAVYTQCTHPYHCQSTGKTILFITTSYQMRLHKCRLSIPQLYGLY